MKWRDLKCGDKTSKRGRKRKTGSEVKQRPLVECVYYHWFTVTQFVCGLLYSVLSDCYLLCLLLFVSCLFCFLFCVFCVFVSFGVLFLLTCLTVSFPSVHKFTDHSHRVETQLQFLGITQPFVIDTFCTDSAQSTTHSVHCASGFWHLREKSIARLCADWLLCTHALVLKLECMHFTVKWPGDTVDLSGCDGNSLLNA